MIEGEHHMDIYDIMFKITMVMSIIMLLTGIYNRDFSLISGSLIIFIYLLIATMIVRTNKIIMQSLKRKEREEKNENEKEKTIEINEINKKLEEIKNILNQIKEENKKKEKEIQYKQKLANKYLKLDQE